MFVHYVNTKCHHPFTLNTAHTHTCICTEQADEQEQNGEQDAQDENAYDEEGFEEGQ